MSRRLTVLINRQVVVGADLEGDVEVPEALIELANSMIRIRNGEGQELKFNDSKRLVLTSCQADRDGDCFNAQCPQLKDRQSHCPLDNS